MPNHVLLHPEHHHDVRVITQYSDALGDARMQVPVFPFEFQHAQSYYPIFFKRDSETRALTASALLGFQEGENLFLRNGSWHAEYVPLMVEREPFLIGFQQRADGQAKQAVIHIDLDSPRISRSEGQPLFHAHGGSTAFLDRASGILKAIHDGQASSEQFFKQIDDMGLTEPFNLDITLENGSNIRLTGFETINESAFAALTDEQVLALHRSGALKLMHLVSASQENIRKLAAWKNQQVSTDVLSAAY
ncbi:SapC family protein [Aestuariibacter sp. AA17]|uniref:SapC family protein n=1 Tax=Fluctibacter corallii TaxID=2984329 RepID=A0ABT3A750_9ALTE|nr:SapC family protein [Aestuariibacter sp. AA17]MCV2884517.1 SapC family protein [Aestuariibacter sp. AA17]